MTTAAAFGFATSRTTTAARSRFAAQSLETATPAQLLVKLYDRLLLDIDRAEAAQRTGGHAAASEQLIHAQAIVSALMGNLDVDAWSGAPRLLSIYTFLFSELVSANVSHDPVRTASCRAMVQPLAEAWRQAAAGTTRVVPAGRDPFADTENDPPQRTSLIG